ncbi:MAG: alpha/beta fold hydrolase [Thermoproteota archaeon]
MGQGKGKWKVLLLILLFTSYVNLLTVVEHSHDNYHRPAKLEGAVFQELWGFNWSENLDVKLVDESVIEFNGAAVRVEHYTFRLLPDNATCLTHAWLYSTGSGGSEDSFWLLLVHGLGGDHRFFEGELGGYKLAYELALRGYKVLAIDAAGHGQSCIPGGRSWVDRAYTIEPGEFFLYYVYLSAVRGVEVAKTLGAVPGRIAVAGVSMGGMTSIVVGSIHPDVRLAIPIVASGCIPCMIESGGLANLVGSANTTINAATVEKLSASDPLAYAEYAASRGMVSGKVFYMLFSGHDEFFPVEGLDATVEALKRGGATVYVAFSGNNNHYRAAPGWIDSVVALVEIYRRGGPARVERALSGSEARRAGIAGVILNPREWRPASDGLAYTVGVPVLPLLLGGEAVVEYTGTPVLTTSLPASIPAALRIAVFATTAVAAYMAARRLNVRRPAAVLAVALVSAAVFAAPFWVWPGRFSLSLLDLMERYAVTPSEALGAPTHVILTVLVLAAPLLLALYMLAARRGSGIAAAVLYVLFSLAPFAIMRLMLGNIASRSPQPLAAETVPLEAAVFVILAAAWRAKQGLASAGK